MNSNPAKMNLNQTSMKDERITAAKILCDGINFEEDLVESAIRSDALKIEEYDVLKDEDFAKMSKHL